MKKISKSIVGLIAFATLFNSTTGTVLADDEQKSYDNMISKLVSAGYTKDTAIALDYDDVVLIYESLESGKELTIDTCATEVDNLSNIENFLSCNEEQLLEIGISQDDINTTTEQLENMLSLEDKKLEDVYNLDKTDVKMLRIAEQNAERNKVEEPTDKVIDNEVTASGSISSSKLTYTQTAVSNSKSKPNYTVKLSYSWKSPYMLGGFNEKIVAAWGGNLNCKNYTGTAKYYMTNAWGTKWKSNQIASTKMSTVITPNAGITFGFPQSKGFSMNKKGGLSKTGSASFTLYQTKKKGYDTTLISYFCHRVISLSSAGISISSSGPSVSIGKAWNKSSQKKSIIHY